MIGFLSASSSHNNKQDRKQYDSCPLRVSLFDDDGYVLKHTGVFNAFVLLVVKPLPSLKVQLAFSLSMGKILCAAQVPAFLSVKLALSEVPHAKRPKRIRFIDPLPLGWSKEPNATLNVHAKSFDFRLIEENLLNS